MTQFTTTKPTEAGIYEVRGWYVGRPQARAVVAVERNDDGDLVCNLHQENSDQNVDDWDTLDQFADDFQWRGPYVYIPLGKGDDKRVNDDSFMAAIAAARSQIGPRRPDWNCPEDEWHWDKLTELMEILEVSP